MSPPCLSTAQHRISQQQQQQQQQRRQITFSRITLGLGWAGLGWAGLAGDAGLGSSTPPPVPIPRYQLQSHHTGGGNPRLWRGSSGHEAHYLHCAAITKHAGCDHGVTARSIRACALAAHCQVCRVQGPPRAARSSSALPASEGGGPAAVKAGHRCLNTAHRISTYLDI